MEVKVSKNNLAIAPRKVRQVVDLTRKMAFNLALDQLKFLNKVSALPIYKLFLSARSAAKDKNLDLDNLQIKEIKVDEGRALKRRRINSRGRASGISKRSSHITLILTDQIEKDKE